MICPRHMLLINLLGKPTHLRMLWRSSDGRGSSMEGCSRHGAHAVLWCLFLHELITDHGKYFVIRYLMSENGNGQYKSGHHIYVLRMSLSFHWRRVIEFRFVSWSRDLGSRRISLCLESQEKAEANESQCILNGFNFPVCKLFQTTRGYR